MEPLREQVEERRFEKATIAVRKITAGDKCDAHPYLYLRLLEFATCAFKWYFGRFSGDVGAVLDEHGTDRKNCSGGYAS